MEEQGARNTTYSYDHLRQLVGERRPDVDVVYTYDRLGHRALTVHPV
ncbi:MAG: hypothetical protein KJ626_06145 [Verrucomicrobia bacterium]|nr:hypothetical protein [Verrucomicrobiota bacterium]